jgi:hypothetical protein
MTNIKDAYKKFLKMAVDQGLSVATSKQGKMKEKEGQYLAGDSSRGVLPSIAVYRDSDDVNLNQQNYSSKVDKFIPDNMHPKQLNWELNVLLHEYGHFKCGHVRGNDIDSEKQAWEIARSMLSCLGLSEDRSFKEHMSKALKKYETQT